MSPRVDHGTEGEKVYRSISPPLAVRDVRGALHTCFPTLGHVHGAQHAFAATLQVGVVPKRQGAGDFAQDRFGQAVEHGAPFLIVFSGSRRQEFWAHILIPAHTFQEGAQANKFSKT